MLYQTRPKDFRDELEVVSCFLEYGGEILLLKRAPEKPHGDTWGVPAGKVDADETLAQAIARELREETSAVVPAEKNLFYFGKVYVRHPARGKHPARDFIYHTFHLSLTEKPRVIINRNEHTDFNWLSPSLALKENLIADEDICIKLFYKLQ